MSEDVFQLKRGTTAAVNAYLPAAGEPVYDVTLKQLKVGDGVTLGGTDPSLSNANLSALAGLTGAADRLAYFTGVGAMALTPLTAVARALLDDTTVAAQRTTLGLGTVATSDVTTSATDTTAGRILKVGDFGVGGSTLSSIADLDALRADSSVQITSTVATSAGLPLGVGYSVKHVGGTSSASGHHQFASPITSVAANRNKVFHRQLFGGAWSAWEEFAYGGANSSITSLTGLTTALSVLQGGTGVTTSTGTGAGVHATSPALTGTPTAPTAAVGTNTTQLATAAMVQAEIANKRTWAAYTPTVTSVSGTFTSISATGKFMVAFGICHFQVVVTVTTKGTGVRPIVSLPVAALAGSQGAPIPAREGVLTGKSGVARITTGLLTAETADYTGTGDLATADGAIIYISGSYPVA
jgi:hypothetical protein